MIAALAVAAAATGTGISTADTTTETPINETGIEPSQAGIPWRVHNFTDHTLTAGEFHRDQGANVGSALAFGGDTSAAALQPGGVTAWAYQPSGYATNKTYNWGRVCYMGQLWTMPRVAAPTRFFSSDINDMYVFAMGPEGGKRLMVTYEKGG